MGALSLALATAIAVGVAGCGGGGGGSASPEEEVKDVAAEFLEAAIDDRNGEGVRPHDRA
jgi:hypothetical protein